MSVVNELAPHGLVDWEPSVDGHLSCSGDKSARPNENSEDTSRNDSESRHKNLSKVSDAWRRTLAHRDGYDPFNSKHPRYTTRKLKQEVQAVLNAEKLSVDDSGKVYGLVQDILELLFEAELHRSTMCRACERMKEQFERDANFIRDLHAKQNVPIAITNTLLDTPFPLTKTNNADISSSISSVNLEGNGTKVFSEPWTGANSFPPSCSPNVIVPPPLPPQSQPFSCVPLIDVTRPPPPIADSKQAANSAPLPPPPPPPPAAPPPSIGIPATNPPPVAADCSFAIPPPARAPSNEVLTPPYCCPLPMWAPTTIHPTVPVQDTVSSVLNATLRPTSNRYSGPFGPPIGSFHHGSSQAVDTCDGLQDCYPPNDVAPFQCFSDRRWNYRRPYNKEHIGGDRQRCFKRRRYSSQSHC